MASFPTAEGLLSSGVPSSLPRAPTPMAPDLKLYRFNGDEIVLPSKDIEDLCEVSDDGRTHSLKVYENDLRGLRVGLLSKLSPEMDATPHAQEFIDQQIALLSSTSTDPNIRRQSKALRHMLHPACPVREWGVDRSDFTALWRIMLVTDQGEEITGEDLPFVPGGEMILHVGIREVLPYRVVKSVDPLPDFNDYGISRAAFILEVSGVCKSDRLDKIRDALHKGYFAAGYIAGLCFLAGDADVDDEEMDLGNVIMFDCLPKTAPDCGHTHPLQLLSFKSFGMSEGEDKGPLLKALNSALDTEYLAAVQSLRFFSAKYFSGDVWSDYASAHRFPTIFETCHHMLAPSQCLIHLRNVPGSDVDTQTCSTIDEK